MPSNDVHIWTLPESIIMCSRWFSGQSSSHASKDDFVIVDDHLSRPRDKIPSVFELTNCSGLDLFEVTVDELQHHFTSGDLTSVQYTAFCLESIRKVGHSYLL